jgi:2-iminobutanoate/2-iminopropanoate deaminase
MNRLSIEVDGLSHGDLPIPVASRIGPFLVTGGVLGVNRLTHELPEDASEQADLMFANLVAVLEAGGATPECVLKLTIWIKDRKWRSIVDPGWLRYFPDPVSRPARHLLVQDLPGKMLIQCEAMAICPEPIAAAKDDPISGGTS